MNFFQTKIFHSPFFLILLIVLTGFTVYSFILGSPFKTMDDEFSIINNSYIKSFEHIGYLFTHAFFGDRSYYRPLVSLSYMLEYHFFGLNTFFYYLTNILLHLASAITIFSLMAMIFKDRLIPFFVSFLFTIQPVQWEAVSNIPGRSILLCAFFYFQAFRFFCLSQEKKGGGFYFLSLAFFFLALLSKESAVILPVLLVTYLWFLKSRPGIPFPRGLRLLFPYAAILIVYLGIRKLLGITEIFHWRSVGEAALGFLTFLRGVITYLRLFFLPTDLHFDRAQVLFIRWDDPELWLTVLFYVFFFGGLYRLRSRLPRPALFFISWFFIELLPVSQIWATVGVQPGSISLAEHFLYTPSVGIFVLMVLSLRRLFGFTTQRKLIPPAAWYGLVSGGCLFLIMTTMAQNIYSSHELAMFEGSLSFSPHNTRIRNSYALALTKLGLFKEAEEHFRKVLEVEPWNVRARIGLGKALCDQGLWWEGISEYEKITDAGNLQDLLEENLKLTYGILARKYLKMIQETADNARAYFSLGVVYSKIEQPQEAVEQYHKALGITPEFKEALFNLAAGYEALGDPAQAAVYYEKMLALEGANDELDQIASQRLESIHKGLTEDGSLPETVSPNAR